MKMNHKIHPAACLTVFLTAVSLILHLMARHMSGFAVSYGQVVDKGQTIGYLGATGRATGTHLHFEVYVGDSRVDPAQYFSNISYYNC